ncbi:MAG: acyloxyacyl hydrolase [Magnetovibrionaceae bacterium]
MKPITLLAGALAAVLFIAQSPSTAMAVGEGSNGEDKYPLYARGGYDSGNSPLGGFLSEIRVGAFVHDFGPFGSRKESGYSGNLEVLFESPDFLDIIWAPRPHLGVTGHTKGDTHQAYFGLTWDVDFLDDFFLDLSFGGSVHTGNLEYEFGQENQKNLGCRLLFRESIALGYRITANHNISAHLDHISNASLCSENEGLDNLGLRYGYRF